MVLRAVFFWLRLFALLFTGTGRKYGAWGDIIWSTKNCIGPHHLDDVQSPDLNLWVEGAHSYVVSELGFGMTSRGGRRKVKPFETKRNIREHKIMMWIKILF